MICCWKSETAGRVQKALTGLINFEIISKVVKNWVMKFRKILATSLVLTGLFQFAPSSFGFALLGPFAPWMAETNGFRQTGDIGGPMNHGEEYRWNVPVVKKPFSMARLADVCQPFLTGPMAA